MSLNQILPHLKYTLCFCVHDSDVLMLFRAKPPNQNLWNGVGGKIDYEKNETPFQANQREVYEETGIQLSSSSIRYCGPVTWSNNPAEMPIHGGMHVFIAELNNKPNFTIGAKNHEGVLAWHPISWVTQVHNSEVASNIPHFFQLMLTAPDSRRYHCKYLHDKLLSVEVLVDSNSISHNTPLT